jgi:tetratricopeptide (TPR) repeat protein
LPEFLDNLRRTVTFRPPKQPARWYEKAIEVLTIAIALNDEKADPQMEANLALNLANDYYNLEEFGHDYAFRYYQIKLQYDSTFGSPRQQAFVFERIGECAWGTRRYDEAALFLKTAIQLFRDLRDIDGELRNLNRLALVYQSKGDYDTSNENFAKVDTVSRRENRFKNLSLVWRNMAYNHQQNKESDDAIAKSGRSLALLEQGDKSGFAEPKKSKFTIKLFDLLPIFWMTVDPFGESSAEGLTYEQEKALLFSITGEGYVAQKDFASAIALFEKKAEAFRRDKNWAGEARVLNNLGNLWYSYHDFEKAYAHFERSFKLCDRLQLPAGKMANLINMSNLAVLQENEKWARAVDSLLQTSKADREQVGLLAPRQKLAALNALGSLYFHAAQRLLSDETNQPVVQTNGNLLHAIERTHRALQNLSAAQAAYDTGLLIAQTNRLPREEVMVRRNLAGAYMLSRDYPSALAQLQRAHEICVTRNFPELTWRIEHALGSLCRFFKASPGLKSAAGWYHSAVQILEGLAEAPEGSEQRITETAEQMALYENFVTLLAEQGETRAALELVERSRSNRFVNLISTRYILPKKERQRLLWGGGGGRAPDLQRTISRLRGELAKLEVEVPQRPKELAQVRYDLAAAEREYHEVVQAALAEDPQLASFFSIQAIDTQALQDSLDEATAILEYFVAENELIIWRLGHGRLEQMFVPISRQQLREQSGAATVVAGAP